MIDKLLHKFGYVHLETSESEFIELLERVRAELHSLIGVEMCTELHADCFDCKMRYLIGLINSLIDTQE